MSMEHTYFLSLTKLTVPAETFEKLGLGGGEMKLLSAVIKNLNRIQ